MSFQIRRAWDGLIVVEGKYLPPSLLIWLLAFCTHAFFARGLSLPVSCCWQVFFSSSYASSVFPPICLPAYLPVFLYVCFVCLFACLSVCLSMSLLCPWAMHHSEVIELHELLPNTRHRIPPAHCNDPISTFRIWPIEYDMNVSTRTLDCFSHAALVSVFDCLRSGFSYSTSHVCFWHVHIHIQLCICL